MKYIVTLSAILLSTSCLLALPSEDAMNQDTEIIANCKSPTSNSNDGNDEGLLNPLLMGGPKKRLEAIGYRLEAEETDEENFADGTTNYESLTDNSNDESIKKLLDPALMGGTVGMTTTAARWLFKTGANKIVTRPFLRLGDESSSPLLPSSISNLPSPTAAAVSPASVRPIGRIVSSAVAAPSAFHSVKRFFSSVPPIKDNTLNSVSKDLTQNNETTFSNNTIEEVGKDLDQRIAEYNIVRTEISVTQGEDAIKLLEKLKKEEQELADVLDQYIRLLSKLAYADEVQGVDGAEKLSVQELRGASGVDISLPSLRDAVETDEARRMKDFDEGLYASCRPSPNSNPTPHSSSLPQVVVDGNETISSNTGATQQFAAEVEFGKKSIRFLQEAQKSAPPALKEELTQRLEEAQYQKNIMVSNILSDKLNRIAAVAASALSKATGAQREEAVKLWEESKNAAQTVIDALDQYIETLQRASATATSKIDLKQRIEEAQGDRNTRLLEIRYHDINKANAIASLTEEKALAAQGEEVMKLLDASRKATQDALEIQDQCIASLQEAEEELIQRMRLLSKLASADEVQEADNVERQLAAKEALSQRIEEAQYRRSSMAYHAITKRTDKIAEITDNAYKKAALLKEEEAVRFWEKSKQLAQSLVEDQELYIASLQAIQKRASLATQADWNQRIEDAKHKRALMICNVCAQEANKAAAINNNAKNRVNAAQSEEMLKLWEESKQATLNLVDAQDQYIKAFQEAQVTASLEKKLALNQSIEEAQNNKAVTVCNIFAMVASKEKILTNMSYHQANTAQGEEAIELWAKAKQAAQSFIEAHDQYIKALQEAHEKAPLTAKQSWNQRIENAQSKRSEILCNILAQDIIGANTIDNMVQAKAAAAQGEEAVKLFEQSKQSSQVLLELRDQYIRIFQKIQDKAPSEMKLALNLVIEKIKDERAETACNVFAKEVSKLRILSTMSQDKAVTARGEEAVRLWTESKKAAQALLEAQDQYMSVLQDVKANTPLETQKKWEQRVDEAQQNRDTKVCSIYCRELFKLNALDDIATAKASAAQGIEAIQLWEESKQVAQELVTAHDQYIVALQEAKTRAAQKNNQKELAQRIEGTKIQRNSIICAICTKEINKARALIFITHDKAIRAEGEEAVRLWEESRKACQSLLDAQNHYIEALQVAKKEASLAMQEELNRYIVKAEFERVMMPCNILSKEINKANIINDMIQKKAIAARGKEAVKLWEESKQGAQKLLELQNQYIKVLREVQAKAPAAAKEEWNQHIEEALRNREIMISNVLSKRRN